MKRPFRRIGRSYRKKKTLDDAESVIREALQPINQRMLDDGSRVDLLLIATDTTVARVGSWANLKKLADQAVNQVNVTIFPKSEIRFAFKLVDVARSSYSEAKDFEQMLNDLAHGKVLLTESAKSGKFAVPIAATDHRDAVGADVVSMFVKADTESGISFAMTRRETSFERFAFSVVWYRAATGHLSLGHELGHNFGCCHDHGNHQGPSLVPYGFGHSFDVASKRCRTIMCAGAPRVDLFSNPNVMFCGVPAGVPSGQPNPAFNAKVMNESAPLVAQFRKQIVP
jgi:hypothetical protein